MAFYHVFCWACGKVHAVAVGSAIRKGIFGAEFVEWYGDFFVCEFVASVLAHFAHCPKDAPKTDEVTVIVFRHCARWRKGSGLSTVDAFSPIRLSYMTLGVSVAEGDTV